MQVESRAGLGVRSENSARRLQSPGHEREELAARFWQEFNVPRSFQGHTALGAIIGQGPHEDMDETAVAACNSFAQWLGTHVGASYLRELTSYLSENGHPLWELDSSKVPAE